MDFLLRCLENVPKIFCQMVFLHGYESHRIRKKRSLQKQIQEMKRCWNLLVFGFFSEINFTVSPSPQTVHQSFLEWQPTNLPRDYQLDIRQFCQLGNQVGQVVTSSPSLAGVVGAHGKSQRSPSRLPGRLAGGSELRHGAALGLSVVQRHRELQAWLGNGEENGKGKPSQKT